VSAGAQAPPNAGRRSQARFGAEGRSGMLSRSWRRNQVIGMASTCSELAPCNAHLNRVAEAVKRGPRQ
jgi:hypothetical protein